MLQAMELAGCDGVASGSRPSRKSGRGPQGAPEAPYESPEHPGIFILSYAKERQMPKGRPTTDPKVNTLRIRLNDEMNRWLFLAAGTRGITVSQLMREIVEEAMKSDSNFSQK